MNRARLAPYAKGKRVLDLYSYIGGWGVQAAAFGASEVFCVDASAFAQSGFPHAQSLQLPTLVKKIDALDPLTVRFNNP